MAGRGFGHELNVARFIGICPCAGKESKPAAANHYLVRGGRLVISLIIFILAPATAAMGALIPPAPPGSITAAPGPGLGQITLSWQPSTLLPAVRYRIYRGAGPADLAPVAETTTLGFVDSGLPDATTFYYAVSGADEDGEGLRSLPIAATTFTRVVPSQPSSVTGSPGPGNGEISVAWQPPTNNGPQPPSEYWVYRGTAGLGPARVRDDDGSMEASYQMNYTDDSAVKTLQIPTGFLDGASDPKLWILGQSAQCGASGNSHRLFVNGTARSDLNPCSVWSSSQFEWKSLALSLSGLRSGSANSFEIREVAGNSSDRNIWFGVDTTNDFGRSIASYDGVDVSGELMWYLELTKVVPSGDAIRVGVVNGTSFRDTGLTKGTRYYHQVSGVNAVGEGSRSEEVITKTFDVNGPPRFFRLTRGPGRGQMRLDWSPPSTTSDPAPTGYKLYRTTGSNPVELIATVGSTPTYVDSGLADGTTYTYHATAVNVAGESAPSNQASQRTYTTLGSPTGVTATRGPDMGQITLSWQAPPPGSDPAATAYLISRGTDPAVLVEVTRTASTTYRDAGLALGTTYFYSVAAINIVGPGTASAASSTTYDAASPGPVAALTASPGPTGGRVSIFWTAPPPNSGQPATGYRIYRATSPTSEGSLVTQTASTSYQDAGLNPATTYFYRVAATNTSGEGIGTTVSVTTWDIPSAPTLIRVFTDQCGPALILDWSPPASNGGSPITRYRIYRGPTAASLSEIGNVSGTTVRFTDSSVVKGQVYYYAVAAETSVDIGPRSVSASKFVPDAGCFSFDSSAEGFTKEVDAPGSEITWDAALMRVEVVTNRSDIDGEVFGRLLPAGVSASSDFFFSSQWRSILKGTGQAAIPIFYSGDSPGEITARPSSIFVYYHSGDLSGPSYFLRYRDRSGVLRINQQFNATPGAPYIFVADYSASSGNLELRILTPAGANLAQGSYRIGSNVADDFGLSRLGVATVGAGTYPEPPDSASVDRISLWFVRTPPTSPREVRAQSDPLSPAISVSWLAPAYDGGSQILTYRVFRTSTTGQRQFVAETTSTSYVDTPGTVGVFRYSVSAVNSVGQGLPSEEASVVKGL